MSFIQIDEQIERELTCIDDLTTEIKILARKGQINLAKQREQDLHNSLEQLEKHRRRKELRSIAVELNLQGKKAKVVKKLAHQA
ncbi:hypothetical protein FCT18_14565 [Lysinibacillus sphaericus]|uniref:Uncharacterized protein n=1 Tax=Lysinibacillus sphaericus TaxID=1421 RepID=A0A2S0K688_LYSSH|nr:hypothetical protein [Lysinibacillus sphaericus]AVK98881.1 hypothetical protein LS41612_22605 [Lysinibacillus sphaericus]MED4545256.1 hypothetical protein [Lysinibacillus sphaericus]TKI18318.1 hypothetical protein FCT18_14565 [Lysinibacillus sphaericus]SUV15100.1 Uncharacterised protein [Lysinibacillus sphaericus]GEC82239.1 hypothetical protein LSP03_19820 [Lysinibacillus sphaericus]